MYFFWEVNFLNTFSA
uniref:Uncharacterized protein n=1 Tax=Rhizophora mucronata TaxID=61149 RepID=A0A2P2NXJ0_RHIMU